MMSMTIPRSSLGTGSRMASRRASMCTVISSEDRVDDMTNEEIVKAVAKLQSTNEQLRLENEIFEKYLSRVEPSLLDDMQQSLEQAAQTAAAQSRALAATLMLQPLTPSVSTRNLSARRGTNDSLTSTRLSGREQSSSLMRIGGALTHREPRLTTPHKADMASRESEELRISLQSRRSSAKHSREDLRARIEMLTTTSNEARDSSDEFRAMVAIAAEKQRGPKIPAETFINHMDECLHKTRVMINKLSLKTSLLCSTYVRAQRHLAQKMEIGDNVRLVDFQQLGIENDDYAARLAKIDREIMRLKDLTGKCSIQSSTVSSNICEQQTQLDKLKKKCETNGNKMQHVKNRIAAVRVETNVASMKLKSIRELKNGYKAPDVIDYLKKKSEVSKLKKEIKVWTRRRNIQHALLMSGMRIIQQMSVEVAADPNYSYNRKSRRPTWDMRRSATPPPPSRESR